jgi:uncharacterized protein (TIRG00374 family)
MHPILFLKSCFITPVQPPARNNFIRNEVYHTESNTRSNSMSVTGKENTGGRKWAAIFIVFTVVFFLVIKHFAAIEKDFLLLEKVESYWLTVAISLQLLTYVTTGLIYQLLLGPFHLSKLPSLKELTKASVVSLFFNKTMPSAGISGNAFFFRFLAAFNIAANNIVAIILAELFIFYSAIQALLILLLFICLFFYRTSPIYVSTLIAGLVIYSIFSITITLAVRKNYLPNIYKRAEKIKAFNVLVEKVKKRMGSQHIQQQDIRVIELLKGNRTTVIKVFLLQLVIFTLDALTIFALFHGIGIHASFFVTLVSLICTQVISLLPFLPGSLLVYEGSMSFFLMNLHLPLGSSIVVTLLFRLLSFWLPLPLGILFYDRWHKTSTGNTT